MVMRTPREINRSGGVRAGRARWWPRRVEIVGLREMRWGIAGNGVFGMSFANEIGRCQENFADFGRVLRKLFLPSCDLTP